MAIATIDEAVADIRDGRMIIIDDEDRENEGDLVCAAERSRPRSSTSWPGTLAA